jgi:hypothetical protein
MLRRIFERTGLGVRGLLRLVCAQTLEEKNSTQAPALNFLISPSTVLDSKTSTLVQMYGGAHKKNHAQGITLRPPIPWAHGIMDGRRVGKALDLARKPLFRGVPR